ncbi:MAG: septum formation protein Maf [Burkholderiales bacterium]|nr:septum formation protein Maf [Burkholderiales bacterium]
MGTAGCQKNSQVVHSVTILFEAPDRRRPAALAAWLDASHGTPRIGAIPLNPRPRSLVLASGSPYRRELLARLGLAFEVDSPRVDEAPLPGEAPQAMAGRLAVAKALAVAQRHPDSLIIGSDQVAVCDGQVLGKPGTAARAVEQLLALSGREASFHTAVCIHDVPRAQTGLRLVAYAVRFRTLERAAIERYVERERPLDCAGSAKAEGLGIALIESMRGTDPTALHGLPLIALVDLLRESGVEVL